MFQPSILKKTIMNILSKIIGITGLLLLLTACYPRYRSHLDLRIPIPVTVKDGSRYHRDAYPAYKDRKPGKNYGNYPYRRDYRAHEKYKDYKRKQNYGDHKYKNYPYKRNEYKNRKDYQRKRDYYDYKYKKSDDGYKDYRHKKDYERKRDYYDYKSKKSHDKDSRYRRNNDKKRRYRDHAY